MTFSSEWRAKRARSNGSGPGGWGHVLNGLGALVVLWATSLYLLLAAGWWPMLIGVVAVPVGGVLVVRGWVRSPAVLALGLLVGVGGFVMSFVVNNAVG